MGLQLSLGGGGKGKWNVLDFDETSGEYSWSDEKDNKNKIAGSVKDELRFMCK